MKFRPRNRRLLLHKVGTEKSNKHAKRELEGFVIPETIDINKKGNEIYKVLDKSPDVSLAVEIGDFVAIETGMVNKREYGEHVYYTTQENYVVGILESYE